MSFDVLILNILLILSKSLFERPKLLQELFFLQEVFIQPLYILNQSKTEIFHFVNIEPVHF